MSTINLKILFSAVDQVTAPLKDIQNAFMSTTKTIELQEVFKDLWGISIATGTLVGFSQSVYKKLEIFEHDVLIRIKQAPAKHLDETGFRVVEQTQWLHVAKSDAEIVAFANTARFLIL